MASSLLLEIISRLDPKGFQDVSQQMENIKTQAQSAAQSATGFADSLSAVKNTLVGGVLALPLINFTREAIRSEEVTARFNLQLQSLNQAISQAQIELLAEKTRKFGIAETELVQGLSQGLTYLKTTTNEMKYLDTALGMTVLKGISLGQAFQQLGMIQLGNTRILRQYGISLDKEIKDPTERVAKAMEELRKKLEPMAKETGTVASEFKKAGATIGDIGEKIASVLLTPLAEAVKAFNDLDASMKTVLVTVGLTFTTFYGGGKILLGVSQIMGLLNKSGIGAAVGIASTAKAVGDTLKPSSDAALAAARLALGLKAVAPAADGAGKSIGLLSKVLSNSNLIIAGIVLVTSLVVAAFLKWKKSIDDKNKAIEDGIAAEVASENNIKAQIDLINEEITTETDLIAKIKELKDAKQALADQEEANRTRGQAKIDELAKTNISPEEYQKQQAAIRAEVDLQNKSAEAAKKVADEKIGYFKYVSEAEKAAGKITYDEAVKERNARIFGSDNKAQLASQIQLTQAYKSVYEDKVRKNAELIKNNKEVDAAALEEQDKARVIFEASLGRQIAAQQKVRIDDITNVKDTNIIKANLIKEAIQNDVDARRLGRESFAAIDKEATARMLEVELKLKRDELNLERAQLSQAWLANAENHKLIVQKEEQALRKIRLDSARASLEGEIELLLATDEEKAQRAAEQEKARTVLRGINTKEQLGKLPEEDRALLRTMQDRSLLQAKITELAQQEAEAKEKERTTMIGQNEKGMWTMIPRPGVIEDKSILDGKGTENLNLALTTTTNVSLTIANVSEMSAAVSAAVVKEVGPMIDAVAKKSADDLKTHNVGASV